MRNKIIRVYFTTSEESRFLAWKYLKKHECKHICFPLYFPNMFSGIIYWLRWIRSMCVVFVHYNKIKNQQRCSFYLIPVLQYLIGLLFPLYCQAKNGLFRLKLINKKVAISFCPTFVQSLVLGCQAPLSLCKVTIHHTIQSPKERMLLKRVRT